VLLLLLLLLLLLSLLLLLLLSLLQCIQKWLGAQAEQRCPMCRRPWEFKAAEAEVQTR
jgi:hypothetical protein